MHEREKIRQLFKRHADGKCTQEELAKLHNWLNDYAKHEAEGIANLVEVYESERLLTKRTRTRRVWYSVAAAALLLSVIGGHYKNKVSDVTDPSELIGLSPDVSPGSSRATLVLANGQIIELTEKQVGIVVEGKSILYEDGQEELVDLEEEVTLLTLSTPKGGGYQIELSDGTKVWLNAGTSLKYPSRFVENERIVELEGEAYFSVAKDARKPFTVVSRGQRIKVLGTEFNVSAYEEDQTVQTTLVEGSVGLYINGNNNPVLLAPNEQSTLLGNKVRKRIVDVEPYIAWKEGHFYFDNTSLKDMMQQMSRWYDVEIVYTRGVPQERFSGRISRDVTLQTVLEFLRLSGVNYRIHGKQLIIE